MLDVSGGNLVGQEQDVLPQASGIGMRSCYERERTERRLANEQRGDPYEERYRDDTTNQAFQHIRCTEAAPRSPIEGRYR